MTKVLFSLLRTARKTEPVAARIGERSSRFGAAAWRPFALLAGFTAFLAIPAQAESLKFQLARPAVIDGKTFAAGVYYLHTPPAGESGSILVVNASTGAETSVAAIRISESTATPEAVFDRSGRETRLKAIRTRAATYEFAKTSELAKAE